MKKQKPTSVFRMFEKLTNLVSDKLSPTVNWDRANRAAAALKLVGNLYNQDRLLVDLLVKSMTGGESVNALTRKLIVEDELGQNIKEFIESGVHIKRHAVEYREKSHDFDHETLNWLTQITHDEPIVKVGEIWIFARELN